MKAYRDRIQVTRISYRVVKVGSVLGDRAEKRLSGSIRKTSSGVVISVVVLGSVETKGHQDNRQHTCQSRHSC